jgi:omega-6 fatty acid desaturase (delta-12 desaturase)
VVAIQNSSHTLTSETTLRDIIKTIPSEYFEKKPLKAWSGALISLIAAALGYASIAFSPWYLLPFAWIFTGTALTGWFVIGHDCGHRSFSNKNWVNDLVGHIAFLPLLFPFHGWRFKHDHHHLHTNKMGEDNAWYPFTVEQYEEGKGLISNVYRMIRTNFWWLGSVLHWANLHFDASLYPERQQKQVKFSYRLVIIFGLTAIPALIYTTGFLGFINFFLMPWLVYHFWMSTFTLVHHTMPDIQFKNPDKWHAGTEQLTGTVHCDYPAWVEWLCHDINVHVPHHVSTGIPSYNLRLAHKSLDKNWGLHLYKTKFSWELIKDIGDRCHIYDSEKCYQTFDQVDAVNKT